MSRADAMTLNAGKRPVAEAVVSELINAFNVPDPDLDYIVELIAIEPAIAAEVLKRSNTIAFAGNEPATDVFEAVTRIGMLEARNAVLSLDTSAQVSAPTVTQSSRAGLRW